ncbi:MAG: hypothetical protein GMKNLPBB_00614 [Myxococcota bacterium]|nr:hypothetical protein [Myxococcota bacterium]
MNQARQTFAALWNSPARLARRAARIPRRHGGVTVVEMTVAMMIIGLMFALAVPGLGALFAADLRTAAQKLSQTIRYVYNYSAMNAKYCRIVFDLDARKYHIECSDQSFLLEQEKARSFDGKLDVNEAEDGQETESGKRFSRRMSEWEEEEEKLKKAPKPVFTAEEGDEDIFREVELPSRVLFDGVWVSHQEERVSKGKAYLYFFPNGFVEKAVIHLASEGGDVYTLEVSPLSGKTSVRAGFAEVPKE